MLKKSTIELGCSDVFVVPDDADIAKAVQAAIVTGLADAGQVCTPAKRFIVLRGVADEFTLCIYRRSMRFQLLRN
jgi:succinate-semialdehyde dehydrogenase/glutarate-semialdehyde dehydrogenase